MAKAKKTSTKKDVKSPETEAKAEPEAKAEAEPKADAKPEADAVDISEPAPGSADEPAYAAPPLGDLNPTADAYSRENLDLILNVRVNLSMEVGHTQIPIRRLLQLNQGSVVELDQMAGQPMNVLVNGTLIAQGEVVLVNERVGIRLTDVISPSERVKSIN